jgi:hypothetical protein
MKPLALRETFRDARPFQLTQQKVSSCAHDGDEKIRYKRSGLIEDLFVTNAASR